MNHLLFSVTTTDFNVAEEANSFEISLALLSSSHDDVEIMYSTDDGTAEKGSDYTDTSGKVTIETGDTTGSFSIPIIDDTVIEENQTFTVRLQTVGLTEFDNHQNNLDIVVSILDNEAPLLTISNGPSVVESDAPGSPAHAIFTISSPVQPATNDFAIKYTPTSSAFVAQFRV